MRKASEFQDLAFSMFNETARRGLMFHAAEDAALNGRTIHVDGQDWINFGSCSYLGLEMDPRLKAGVIDAVTRYGTQFSSSRAMVSAPPYSELEALLNDVFGVEVLLSASTSMGHVGAIPMLIGEEDAIILDQQVHMSVETATRLARVNGTPIELIRHNRLDQLEAAIVRLRRQRRRIWYMVDGLYSMYGDFAPLEGILALMERYEQLWVYCDDAHAMSWCGPNGRGHVLGSRPLHDRMVVATSLNKAFACAGGVLLMRDAAMRNKIKTVGGPLIYSGPIQPPMLGAAIASARIHLSDEIGVLQGELLERIRLCNRLLHEQGLPLISQDETPVRFVGTGSPRVTYQMVHRLQAEGLYVNAATFPVVPMNRAGIRFTITRHHRLEDIERLCEAIARHLPAALAEEESSLERVAEAFELTLPKPQHPCSADRLALVTAHEALRLERYTSIEDLAGEEWDRLLGANGSFSAEGLRLLEATFRNQPRIEDNWRFFYYVVRDREGTPLLATFFSAALWKDDMIAAVRVSRLVEEKRQHDPYYLTTQTFGMGSLLTEGEHLYLDRGKDWRAALSLLLKAVEADQRACGAPMVVFRDVASDDRELEELLYGYGFAKFAMPESLVLDLDWTTEAEYVARLTLKSRRHQRKDVLPWDGAYDLEVLGHGRRVPSEEEMEDLYRLYLNVKERGLEYNTFELPRALFRHLLDSPSWELVTLRLRPEYGGQPAGKPTAFMASFVGRAHYAPIVAGLDYAFVPAHGAYRQLLRQAIQRARAHGSQRVLLGMGAAFEKHRFGARVEARSIYFRTQDEFPLEVLAKLFADARE